MSDKCKNCQSAELKGIVYRPTCNTCGWSCDIIEDDVIYMLLPDGAEWEDMILFLNKEDAIEASKKYIKMRVEIFKKQKNKLGYQPTYFYYENGILINNN